MQVIKFLINGKGEVKIETSGFEGKSCAETTEKLVLSLKGKLLDEEKKPEYWNDNNAFVCVLNHGS